MSLKNIALNGIVWSFIDTVILKGGVFLTSIYLARILGPEEFGLLGMITVFVSLGTALVDSGLQTSLIRHKEADSEDYNSVFFLNIALSLVAYLCIYLAAPPIAQFFNQPVLINIVRVYCLGFILSAFSVVQVAVLMKEFKFKQIVYYNIPSTLIGIVIGVVLGLNGFGIWSVIYMYLSAQFMYVVFLWIFSDWSPRLQVSKAKMRFHFTFGYKLLLSTVLNATFSNIYNVIIGKLFPVKILGFYDRANTFNQYPVTVLTSVVSKVFYPLLSSLKDDQPRISKVFKQLLQLTFFITAPLMLGAAAIAEPLIKLVLGDQWLPSVIFFQILCLSGMFYPIHSFNINVLNIYGRSDLFLKLEVIKKVVLVLSVAVMLQFGIYGLLANSVFISLISIFINTHYSGSIIQYTTKDQCKGMIPTIILAIIMSLFMFALQRLLNDTPLIVQIIIPSIFGLLLYVVMNYFFAKENIISLITILKNKTIV